MERVLLCYKTSFQGNETMSQGTFSMKFLTSFFDTDLLRVNLMSRVLYFLELIKYLLPMIIVSIMGIACVIANRVIYMTALDKADELSYSEGLGFPMINDLLNKKSTNPR